MNRYSFDLLKSQLLKATKRRDTDGMPLNGRIPRSDKYKIQNTKYKIQGGFFDCSSPISVPKRKSPISQSQPFLLTRFTETAAVCSTECQWKVMCDASAHFWRESYWSQRDLNNAVKSKSILYTLYFICNLIIESIVGGNLTGPKET